MKLTGKQIYDKLSQFSSTEFNDYYYDPWEELAETDRQCWDMLGVWICSLLEVQ